VLGVVWYIVDEDVDTDNMDERFFVVPMKEMLQLIVYDIGNLEEWYLGWLIDFNNAGILILQARGDGEMLTLMDHGCKGRMS